ncbi:hypothetical protein Tco_0942988 [Tanacetum coccineum]
MEILLEPTSNKLMVGDLRDYIRIKLVTAGKKRWCDSIRIKLVPGRSSQIRRILKDGGEDFRYSDTERLSRSDEVLKLKNFKKDGSLKLFKSTNHEWYEHVGPKVTSSQDDKVNKMAKRDYAWLMTSRCSRSHSRQAKEQAQDLKSMITTSNHKFMIEFKRAQE